MLASAHSLWGFSAVRNPRSGPISTTQQHQEPDPWLWSPEHQQMKSVPALYLSVELLISKVMQLQKTPKCGILAPSELSQTIPLIFLHHNGGSSPSHWAPGAAGGSTQQQLCPTAVAVSVLQPQIPSFKLKYFWAGFTEAVDCYAKWPRCLWCNNFSQLFSQMCFVKSLKFLVISSNTDSFPLFYHIYHVLDGMNNMQMIREGVVRT